MAIRGGFQIAEAYVELILDKDEARRGLRNLPRDLGPDADRSGQHTGNILTRGIRLSIVRNSPLIAAAIAGALSAGAPLALAAATTLFAGIGAVAAAQSQAVRTSWQGLWDYIKSSSQEDAAILVPTFVNMAYRIRDTFESLRPAMRDAFDVVGPQIDLMTTSIGRMTESIVGGLLRAVERAGPVIQGFGSFLESTGTGLAGMFDAMSEHSSAAGSAWRSLGDIVGTLLPILGELLGTGVEIAATMLPMLAGALHVVLGALQLLGPILPVMVNGLAAFRTAQVASGYLTGFAQSLAFASYGSGPFAGAMGAASTAVGGLGRALPIIGIAIGAVSSAMQASENRTNDFAQALLKGGESADRAYQQMGNPSFWDKFLFNLTHWGNTQDVATAQTEEAEKAARDYLASLTPLGRAQHEASVAQTELNEAIDRFGVGSAQANRAQAEFEKASAAVERQLAAEEAQLRGVTDAMLEMADAAFAQADASFALRKAHKDTAEAHAAVLELERQGIRTGDEYVEALWAREEAIYAEVEAARKLAEESLPAVMDADERKAASDLAALERLRQLEQAYGTLSPTLATLKADLERSTAGMDHNKIASDALAASLEEVGLTVDRIPDSKSVIIESPSQPVLDMLRELGFTVEQIPGSKDVIVTAESAEAEGNMKRLSSALQNLDGTTARPRVEVENAEPTQIILDQIMAGLGLVDGYTASPTLDLDNDQFETDIAGAEAWMLGMDGRTATPTLALNDIPFVGPIMDAIAKRDELDGSQANVIGSFFGDSLNSGIQNGMTAAAQLDRQRPTPVAGLNNIPLIGGVADAMSRLGKLGGQRPTPASNLNNIPLIGGVATAMGRLGTLGAQTPTPRALMDKRSFDGTYAVIWSVITALGNRVVYPRAFLEAIVGPAENALNYTARTRYSTVYQTVVPAAASGGHVGDIVGGLRRFASGGRPGGRIVGPGNMFDDLIAAVTDGGEPIRVSNREWIVPGMPAEKYGPERMRAIVDGSAVVLTQRELANLLGARGFVDGGPAGDATVTRTADGAAISIGELRVEIKGIFDFTRPAEVRRLALAIREAIRNVERETS